LKNANFKFEPEYGTTAEQICNLHFSIFILQCSHVIKSSPAFAVQTSPQLPWLPAARIRKPRKSRSAFRRNSASAAAKPSATPAREDARDSLRQCGHSASTRSDRSRESANRPRVSTRLRLTAHATPAMKPNLPDKYDSGAACPCNPARTAARRSD